MNYMVLSAVSWEDYEYKRLLELLPDRAEVRFAGRMTAAQQGGSGISSLSLEEMYTLNTQEYTAIVSSPFWLPEVLALQPAYTVALLEACPEGEDSSLWDKYSALLAAEADLVGTPSERIYLEQSLRRTGIVYLGGDSPLSYGMVRREGRLLFLADYEAVWHYALAGLWNSSAVPWSDIQRRHRADFYLGLCLKMPHHPTVHYMAASYLYLLGDKTAALYLKHSLELMLLHDYTDCLHSHYRFFSAIEAKQGNLELAAVQYAITAFTAEERARAADMQRWLDNGQTELFLAEIFRANEDAAAAVAILEEMPCLEAKSLLLLNYIETCQWEKALELQHAMAGAGGDPSAVALGMATTLGPGAAAAAGLQLPVIEGTLHLLHGRRHDAIRSFLRVAGTEHEARTLFAEMADLEEAVHKLRRRIADEDA